MNNYPVIPDNRGLMDRFTGMTVFTRVVECGGFSAAARRLNMSATMVSHHVQTLEDRLGVRLLNRTARKVSVTEVGQAYYERALRILADLAEEGFDLAIRTLVPPDSSLVVRRLTPWRHILCCAPPYLERHGLPARLEDLAHHNCLRYAHYPFGDEWRFEGPDGQVAAVKVASRVIRGRSRRSRYSK